MGSELCFPVNEKPFKGDQHSTLACNLYYVHYITHGTKGATFFYEVLGKFRFVVCELIVSVVFSEPHVELSTSLSDILFVACLARELIYSILVKFVWFVGFCISKSFPKLLLVVYATLKDVFLKSFVMYLVSLPTYVNLTHLLFWSSCSCLYLCFVFLPNLLRSEVSYLLL